MLVFILEFLSLRSCTHKSQRQRLLCLVGYCLIFSLLTYCFLNLRHPGILGGGKHKPLPTTTNNAVQLILRHASANQQEEEMHVSTNFIYKGNLPILDGNTQKNIPILEDTDEERPPKKDLLVPPEMEEEKQKQEEFHKLTFHHPDNRTSLEDQFKQDLNKHRDSDNKLIQERTGESVADENAALHAKKKSAIHMQELYRPSPLIVQYYHSVIDNQPFTNRYNTCAIVSSSGQLLGKNAGPEIDSADCVIRMNAAPVRGYEADVGRRTTLRVACFVSSSHLTSQANELLGGVGKPETVLFWGLEAPDSKKKAESIPRVASLQRRFMDITFYSQRNDGELAANRLFERETGANRKATNSWLSTGWFTLMTALDICGQVRVYGMVPDDHCVYHENEKVKYHYYQWGTNPTECSYYKANEATPHGGHRFMTEKAVFARWAQSYNLTFYHPSWNRSLHEAAKKIDTPFAKIFHLKGMKYFRHGSNSGRTQAGESAAALIGVAVVISVPILFICVGSCVATCLDEEVDPAEARYSRRRWKHHRHN